jgi:hypothetical protein
MNRGDVLVERGAAKLEQLSRQAARKSGPSSKLAEVLADDAVFLRKLKPSLIAARARGEAPTDQPPGSGSVGPSGPQLGSRPKPTKNKKRKARRGGPNPFLVAGVALAAGIALAKIVDWRGHAHPRD